jgi:hypothetical protein
MRHGDDDPDGDRAIQLALVVLLTICHELSVVHQLADAGAFAIGLGVAVGSRNAVAVAGGHGRFV